LVIRYAWRSWLIRLLFAVAALLVAPAAVAPVARFLRLSAMGILPCAGGG